MPSTARVPDEFFGLSAPESAADLPAERVGASLRERGVAGLTGLASRDEVLAAVQLLMGPLRSHRDSGPDGLTVLRDLGQAFSRRSGFAGLGRAALAPHTEGTQAENPPRLILLACQRGAKAGGQTVLVDGRAVLGELTCLRPGAVEALSAPRAAFFGGADGRFTPVLGQGTDGRWQVRLRQDDLARFSPDVQPHLPALREALRRHTRTILLRPGQAVLIDNHRVLHGRTAFTGERLFLRALGDPHPRLRLAPGFAPLPAPGIPTAEG
ncbi:TauD/TfdA family dioxygenase [Kitasatospora aureofaciens]|uniref:TauD/TfdA family dioxygenase n=1 Tax=Kitasatospora aureofaciens TaxID=1894 RepID=UPI001C47041F|nr:TauD/TfdA family dioxygenase [Kitasatospora aureofaciens]MBV6699399.1 TauD/TfdA family dioxygenase [Kitasatospora aureofaciens]